MKIKKYIPSAITAANLLLGSIAGVLALNGDVKNAVILIILAAVLDFLDGFFAKILKATSEFGKQLDSLADLISFGMAPACLMFFIAIDNNIYSNVIINYLPFIIVMFTAFRLAKFNIDTEQTTEFKGLPSPASALFLISLVYFLEFNNNELSVLILNKYVFSAIIILISGLMVSNIKMLSLKIREYKIKKNIFIILLIISSVILLILFKFSGITLIIILYIALSIFRNLFKK